MGPQVEAACQWSSVIRNYWKKYDGQNICFGRQTDRVKTVYPSSSKRGHNNLLICQGPCRKSNLSQIFSHTYIFYDTSLHSTRFPITYGFLWKIKYHNIKTCHIPAQLFQQLNKIKMLCNFLINRNILE